MLIATEKYLEKIQASGFSKNTPVSEDTGLIVIIPAYNEPDILQTIDSLLDCEWPDCTVEILVLLNVYVHSSNEILQLHKQSLAALQALAAQPHAHSEQLRIIPHSIENLQGKQTGAGIPRKILMDEAFRRLVSIDNEAGVIVSLDADCTVDKNYLKEIYQTFKQDRKLCSASIEFHHPVEHLPENDPLRIATEQYELYLRYYRSALAYCTYPYPYYTIGSALVVRASVYAKAGGMGKQEAGEDFYFMQKVFPLGKTKHIDTTTVYPAARLSDRVPFGTGTSIRQIMSEKGMRKMTYSFESFHHLKILFDAVDRLYVSDKVEIEKILSSYPVYLQRFLHDDGFIQHVEEIKANVSGVSFFRKRFFNYFNAFKIVKYLNFVHPEWLPLRDVREETIILH
ncbi:MAG: hypothetical protein LBM08_08170 [Dysgonamonadaceae bacterium]|jgi:hypothetical protein|nr:hypothetical protein [Dysgonamonadaceae bacterium]